VGASRLGTAFRRGSDSHPFSDTCDTYLCTYLCAHTIPPLLLLDQRTLSAPDLFVRAAAALLGPVHVVADAAGGLGRLLRLLLRFALALAAFTASAVRWEEGERGGGGGGGKQD